MLKIVIVSDDNCFIKKVTNALNKTNPSLEITIYNTKKFKEKISNNKYQLKNSIYIIDTYNIENEFLEIIRKIRETDLSSPIIIISMEKFNTALMSTLFHSNIMILDYIEKWNNPEKKLNNDLLYLLKIEKKPSLKPILKITDKNIPITLNENDIENIYHLPNNQISINYKNGNNNILVSLKYTTKQIKELAQNSFFIDKKTLKTIKRTNYTEPFKQLLVDLYLIFKIDSSILSKHFRVNEKYIKQWSSLVKYNRKINIIEFIIGKIIIKSYFKKQKERN